MVARPNLKQLAAMVLFACWLICASSATAQSPPKRVLLVFGTDGTHPLNAAFEQSLLRNLRESIPNLEFYREQLESARFPESTEHKIAEIRSQFVDRKIDVVFFRGNIPKTILPGVPVVQIDNGSREQTLRTAYGSNAVHVSFDIDVRKIVEAARRLQPMARKVLLISGASAIDHVDLKQFRQRIQNHSTLDIEAIGDASIQQLCDRLSHLPRDVIVVPTGYYSDPQGNAYVPRDVLKRFAAVSTAPLYATAETLVGIGTVGGYVVSAEKTAEIASDAALQILRGKPPAEVVLKSSGSGVYMFDWRQLKRWGFSESDLPPGSIVLFKVPTAWEQYRWRIVGIVVLIIAQSLLIASLLIQRLRRRHAEESVRDIAGRLLQSQDDERRRIARDLHDGTGQHLSGIALSVGQVLADFPPGHDRLRQLLQDSHVASRQALNEVRAVSYALHPPILDGLGLIPALHWYLDGLQKRTSFNIDFDAPADLADPAPDATRTLFRIVQESVTNVLRHSGGTAMKVKLFDSGKSVTLEIEDNGRGMSVEELERAEGTASLGVGIAGMRERVRQLRGTFKIRSSYSGTTVLVSLPTHEDQHATHSAG